MINNTKNRLALTDKYRVRLKNIELNIYYKVGQELSKE